MISIRGENMDVKIDVKKLKILFVVIVILLIIIVTISVKNSSKFSMEIKTGEVRELDIGQVSTINTSEMDFNNLSTDEQKYLSKVYDVNISVSEKGVEVYAVGDASGRVSRTITSIWPENDLSKMIPKPVFGDIKKIEYNESWMNATIASASKNEVKKYVKELKNNGFSESQDMIDYPNLIKYFFMILASF